MGIRFWSMLRFPVDTQDIGGLLRRKDGNKRSALYSYRSQHNASGSRKWIKSRIDALAHHF